MERLIPRDMFVEAGYGPSFAAQLIQNAYSKLFEGDPINERVCFDASDDMSYIIDIGHDDIRSEGMSYGMYITALTGHERQFDKLWNFSKRYLRNDDGPHAECHRTRNNRCKVPLQDGQPFANIRGSFLRSYTIFHPLSLRQRRGRKQWYCSLDQ